MQPQRVTVWRGFWNGGIIGPFFFENEQGVAVMVNGERYRAMLNGFLFPKIEEDDMDDIWFQHTPKTVSLNQRNISLTCGQRKNFIELKNVC